MKIIPINCTLITFVLLASIYQGTLNAEVKLPLAIGFATQYTGGYNLNTATKELDEPTRRSFDSMDLQTLAQSIGRMFHNLQVVQAEYNRAQGEQLRKEFREALKELQLRLLYAQHKYDHLARQLMATQQKPVEYAPVQLAKGRQPLAITNEGERNPFEVYDSMSRAQLEDEIQTLETKINGSRLAFKRDATKENREILQAWEREFNYVQNLLNSKRR